MDAADQEVGHMCKNCDFSLNEEACTIFEELPSLEDALDDQLKSNLVHVAGYVVGKEVNEATEESFIYYEKYGAYTRMLNRGGLKIPEDSVCQWSAYSYIMFESIKTSVCRISLMKVLQDISDNYGFSAKKCHCMSLANISSICIARNLLYVRGRNARKK